MNNKRRKYLSDIIVLLNDAYNKVESTKDDEQYCLDSIPENLSGSERAEKIEDCVDHLDDALTSIEEAIDNIKNAIG